MNIEKVGPTVADILNYLGSDWVVEEGIFGKPQFRYTPKDRPDRNLFRDRKRFEEVFVGYSFDMYKVGGVGYIIMVRNKL